MLYFPFSETTPSRKEPLSGSVPKSCVTFGELGPAVGMVIDAS
uniref:Uncharacterized protein n=1 Tax=Burkholderia cepacia TaxID=292 RepID=J9R8N5_BURCE|nr:hypothetical protein pYS10058 [Burkholderia cepacia]